jgi:NOL1/NOP2/fmu family ribosome biogenesis protein
MRLKGEKLKNIIANFLEEQFGIDKADFLKLDLEFEERGKRRVYAFKSCDLEVPTYHYGIYFGTLDERGFRLSIEGCFLVGKLAKKNILEVDDKTAERWMKGEDIECNLKGYVIVKWKDFFLGCGKSNGKILRNFVPKNRRIPNP